MGFGNGTGFSRETVAQGLPGRRKVSKAKLEASLEWVGKVPCPFAFVSWHGQILGVQDILVAY